MLALGKCKPCSALDFKGVGNKMAMDDRIFCKPDTSLSLKWRKFPVKAGSARGLTPPPKSLIAIEELQCDFFQK